jgi:hypothetical protein
MKKNQLKLQITLVSIGFFLIFLTYFLPNLNKSKNDFFESQKTKKEDLSIVDQNDDTTFEKVEYQGLYDFNKKFTVTSEEAKINKGDPDIVYMTNMHVILHIDKNRLVNIYSDKGTYNKLTYDCYFENNVKATDGETEIFADNLNLLTDVNYVKIFNNVTINNPTGNVIADIVDYDLDTKYFKVSMFNEDAVKIKVFK